MESKIRKKLLQAFTANPNEYLSGQTLAEVTGCSRTAIWKHMEELRKEGFELEAVRKKGYKIIQAPEKITADEIRLGLMTETIGQSIHYEESVDSTQKVAQKLAYEGVPEGTIVVAEEQFLGKGRMDRNWYSPKYTGVWMSVILKPNIPIIQAPQLTLLTAVAVVQAIEELTNLLPKIKWPNDILINDKKVTGILTELQADADRINAVIIGIGMNVNQKEEDYPEELKTKATSLYIEEGKRIKRSALIQAVLYRLEKLYYLFLEEGFYPIKLLWESYAVSIGVNITARTLKGNIIGESLGITNDGVLLIKDSQETVHHVYSADIEIEK